MGLSKSGQRRVSVIVAPNAIQPLEMEGLTEELLIGARSPFSQSFPPQRTSQIMLMGPDASLLTWDLILYGTPEEIGATGDVLPSATAAAAAPAALLLPLGALLLLLAQA